LPFESDQRLMVGSFAQTRLGEAFAGAVVEEDAILLAGPDGIGPELSRSACLEKQAARLVLTTDNCLIEGCQARLQAIVIAQDLQTCWRSSSRVGRLATSCMD